MSHHQVEDGRAEMNNHAFLRTQKCCGAENSAMNYAHKIA